jgi:ABC-type amino acid transport substrate-binding protein
MVVSKGEMIGRSSAAAAFVAAAASGLTTANFDQATMATTIAVIPTATPMILLISEISSIDVALARAHAREKIASGCVR